MSFLLRGQEYMKHCKMCVHVYMHNTQRFLYIMKKVSV